jgi:predicted alpha/beta hydrolase
MSVGQSSGGTLATLLINAHLNMAAYNIYGTGTIEGALSPKIASANLRNSYDGVLTEPSTGAT